MIKRLLFILLTSFLAFQAQADTDWKKVEDEARKLFRSKEFVESSLDQFNLTGTTRIAFRENFVEIYRNDEVIKQLIEEIRSIGWDAKNSKDSQINARAFGQEFFVTTALKGLNRLSFSDQKYYFTFLHKWMKIASPTDCKMLLTEGNTKGVEDLRAVEMKYYSQFTLEEMRGYLRVLRTAMLSEIRDFPPAKTLNANQVKIANEAWQLKFNKVFDSKQLSPRVLSAILDMQNAPAQDTCEAGIFLLHTITQLEDSFIGELLLTHFVMSMR